MLHHSPSHHAEYHKYFHHKKLDAIYASLFIKLFAEAFISVFTAIYLLSIGYKLTQISLYYIVYFTVLVLSHIASRPLMKYVGVVKTIALGIVVLAIYYYLLRDIAAGVHYLLIAALYGVGAGLYFGGFNVELSDAIDSGKKEGSTIAVIRIIAVLTSIVGPVLGGLFVSRISFSTLFFLVAGCMLLSLVPLFFAKDYKVKLRPFSISRILRLGTKRRIVTYLMHGAVESGLDILWPAFIYLNYQNFTAVGGIVSLTSLIMTIVIYFIGKYSDLKHVESYKTGVLLHAPTWILRILLLSPGGLLISNILGSTTSYLIDIPYNKAVFHSAKKLGATDYFIFKESVTLLGRVGILATTFLISDLKIVFIFISVITIIHLVLVPELKSKAL